MKCKNWLLRVLAVLVSQAIVAVAERPSDQRDAEIGLQSILSGIRSKFHADGSSLARRSGGSDAHGNRSSQGDIHKNSYDGTSLHPHKHPAIALLEGHSNDFRGAMVAGSRGGNLQWRDEEHQNRSREKLQSGKQWQHHSKAQDPDQKTKEAEEKAQKAETSAGFGSAVGSLAGALSDPVGWLKNLEPVKAVESALKLALDAQGGDKKGKCLADSSNLDGLGCSDKQAAQLCECYRTAEQCYVPANAGEVAKLYTTNQQEGLEEIMALLYGRCYRPIWFWILLVMVPIVLIIIALVARSSLRRGQTKDDSDSD